MVAFLATLKSRAWPDALQHAAQKKDEKSISDQFDAIMFSCCIETKATTKAIIAMYKEIAEM